VGVDEDAQSGGRYVRIGLFCEWKTDEYLDCFAKAGFECVWLVLELSKQALEFRRRWPGRFDTIAAKNNLSADDLIIKTHIILLRKP
jgi:hypothetical protein